MNVRQSIFRRPRQIAEPSTRQKVAPEGYRYFIRAHRQDRDKAPCSFDFLSQEEYETFLKGEPSGRWMALQLMEQIPQAK